MYRKLVQRVQSVDDKKDLQHRVGFYVGIATNGKEKGFNH